MEKKKIFLAGIGGIGVSGLARLFLHEGYSVIGWDLNESVLISNLRKEGAVINTGSSYPPLDEDLKFIVHTHAVAKEHPLLKEAEDKGISVYERGEYLAKILSQRKSVAVTGSHGKTTVTFMIAHLLRENGINPTVYGGGIENDKQSNFTLGTDDLIVAEMDESDKTFAESKPEITIITNLDFEHVNEYSSYSELINTAGNFIKGLSSESVLIINGDDLELKRLANENFKGRELILCGYNEDNSYMIMNPEFHQDRIIFSVKNKNSIFHGSVSGFITHNVINLVMAGCALIKSTGKSHPDVFKGSRFKGVKRRFEYLKLPSEKTGFLVTDYGHHPQEIYSVLKSVREKIPDREIAVLFEAHRISRLKMFLKEFTDALSLANLVFLADLHRAGEDGDYEGVLEQIILTDREKFFRVNNSGLTDKTEYLYQKGYNVIVFSAGKIDAIVREYYNG